tara:strand:- start:4860 stop:5084 length:225 start_codon:yes stop_codon:yes gene_type:complete
MEKLFSIFFIPQTKNETILYMVDAFGLILSAVWITGMKETLSIYILIITAISLTITVGVKIHNLFNSNDENKKI